MKVFAKVGFLGACGSIDVTYFCWDQCPRGLYNFCKGKYPDATLAHQQCVVDYHRRILCISEVYNGRKPDNTLTYNDSFTKWKVG